MWPSHVDARRVDARGGCTPGRRPRWPRVGQEERGSCAAAASSSSRSSGVGGPRAGVDALLEVGVVQQPELAVVDQLVLLALAQRLDGQPELLLGLVHRLVVEVGDAGVDPQHGLRDAQLVLAGRQLVVDEGARQRGLALVAGGDLDLGLAVLVLPRLGDGLAAPPGASRSARRLVEQRLEACRGERSARCTAVTAWAVNVPVRPSLAAAPARRSGRRRRARRARSRRRTCRRRSCSTLPCAIR